MSGKKEYGLKAKRPRNKAGIVFLNLFVWLFLIPVSIIAILGMLGKLDTPTTTKANQTKTPAKTIGQPADEAGFRFVVNSIKCGEKRISYNDGVIEHYAEAQGQFCRLNLTVTNIGNTANSTRHYYQHVLNAQGQKYDADSGATGRAASYDLGNPFDEDINPGNNITGDIVFDVPVGVTPTTAELHGNNDSLGVRVKLR
jgi:hypothetical protein